MHRTTALPFALALSLAVLAGCGAGAAPETGPSPSPTSVPASPQEPAPTSAPATPEETSSPEQPFVADLRPDDGGNGSGNGLTVTDVRVGRHDGYDRVVLELAGDGRPGWRVEYVDAPRADGTGYLVDLAGSSFLQVDLRAMGMPSDIGAESTAPDLVPGAGGVAEVAPGGVFEGHQLAFVGLRGEPRPFRAYALTDPARVVVDVVDE